jgi:hypothetical protein
MAKRKKTLEEMGDDLAIESLQHAQMNETRDYVERGRALASQTDDEVKSVWVAMFEKWFDEKTPENARNMDDAAAELRLRDLEPPYDRVKAKQTNCRQKLNAAVPALFPKSSTKRTTHFSPLAPSRKTKSSARSPRVASRSAP